MSAGIRGKNAGPGSGLVVFGSPSAPRQAPDLAMASAAAAVLEPARTLAGTNETGDCMSEYEFTISLRLRHPTIDPSRITETLGMEPQHTWRAGDARRNPAGQALEGVYRESYWMGRLMEEPQLSSTRLSVESVLLQTLAHLRRSVDFLEQLHAEGGVAELHVSLYAREDFRLELSAESLGLLGRLGLEVVLDVHPRPSTGTSGQAM